MTPTRKALIFPNMTCHHCGEKFAANRGVAVSPGYQEPPGVFLGVAIASLLAGVVLFLFSLPYWGTAALVAAGFTSVQLFVSIGDCRLTTCPKCRTAARIRPWSL